VTGSRLAVLLLALAGLLTPLHARAAELYAIDRRSGRIEFSVGHLGMFRSHGEFTQFDSKLIIDRQHPEHTTINVVIHVGSVSMPWENAVELLRSPEFFDAVRYPDARFSSTSVVPLAADHYLVKGTLEIRGVTRPIDLDATLVGRHTDPATRSEVADFVVQGHLQRSEFGITAESVFISDRVDISITARLQLVEPPRAG
jgi:polyisoprenoid-binding protein YceI